MKFRDLIYIGRTNYAPNGTDIRIGHWVLTISVRLHKEEPFA